MIEPDANPAPSPGHDGAVDVDELLRAGHRLADRLRVLGPRWAEHPSPTGDVALGLVRSTLQGLADLAATAQGRPLRPVPSLGLWALADQVIVLVNDVLDETDEAGRASACDLVAQLRAALP